MEKNPNPGLGKQIILPEVFTVALRSYQSHGCQVGLSCLCVLVMDRPDKASSVSTSHSYRQQEKMRFKLRSCASIHSLPAGKGNCDQYVRDYLKKYMVNGIKDKFVLVQKNVETHDFSFFFF